MAEILVNAWCHGSTLFNGGGLHQRRLRSGKQRLLAQIHPAGAMVRILILFTLSWDSAGLVQFVSFCRARIVSGCGIPAALPRKLPSRAGHEIGRASCRERV